MSCDGAIELWSESRVRLGGRFGGDERVLAVAVHVGLSVVCFAWVEVGKHSFELIAFS